MLYTLLYHIGFVPTAIFFSLWSMLRPQDGDKIVYYWGKTVVLLCGARIDAEPFDLPSDKPYVFFAPHQSMLDIGVLCVLLRKHNLRFVGKESLFSIPIIGWGLASVGHISVNRGNSRAAMKSLDAAAKRVNAGQSIMVFPEGTREGTFEELKEFKTGGIILALKAKVPVVPVVYYGTGRICPKGARTIRPGVVKVRVLPPIDVAERYTLKQREQFRDDVYEQMNAVYLEQKAELKQLEQSDAS